MSSQPQVEPQPEPQSALQSEPHLEPQNEVPPETHAASQSEPQPEPQPQPPSRAIVYLPTTEAYNKWAAVYDTDNNFLQAMDTAAQQTWLPALLDLANISPTTPATLVDLGCGTGRTTLALAAHAPTARILALDSSAAMLAVARDKTPPALAPRVTYRELDLLGPRRASSDDGAADALVSTLVVEHIPLATFFAAVAALLKPGGVALVSNMHADMGAISQAGFVDGTSGAKVRPTSYAHALGDVVGAAARVGLRAVRVEEQAVQDGDEVRYGTRCRKWIGVKCWFGILFRSDRDELGSDGGDTG